MPYDTYLGLVSVSGGPIPSESQMRRSRVVELALYFAGGTNPITLLA